MHQYFCSKENKLMNVFKALCLTWHDNLIREKLKFKLTCLEGGCNFRGTVSDGIGTNRGMSKTETGNTSPRIVRIQIKKARLTSKSKRKH